ncbi:MAG: hypothetical protein ACI9YE_001259, partial [Psychroserpens sp.]
DSTVSVVLLSLQDVKTKRTMSNALVNFIGRYLL